MRRWMIAAFCAAMVAGPIPAAQALNINIGIGLGGGHAKASKAELKFFTDKGTAFCAGPDTVQSATAGWEPDSRAQDRTSVEIVTRAQNCSVADVSFAGFTAVNTGMEGKDLSELRNLGFRMRSNYVGAGSPRFSINLASGTSIFASAFYCPGFGTGTNPDPVNLQAVPFLVNGVSTCLFSDNAGLITNVSWATVLAQYGADDIDSIQFVQDEGPAFVRLDDIRVQRCLFKKAGKVRCNS